MTESLHITLCRDCAFWGHGGDTAQTCRRHAPFTSAQEFEIARWAETRALDACGEGRQQGDTKRVRQTCELCMFWHRPGIGIDPGRRSDRLRAWWQRAGYCRRYAPRPGSEIGEHAFWRATHAEDYCYDGHPGGDA